MPSMTALTKESSRRLDTALAERLGLDPTNVLPGISVESHRVDGHMVVTIEALMPEDEFYELFNSLDLEGTK